MTVSSTTTSVSYTGDGGTTAFPVTFIFFGTTTTAELTVVERTIATGAETTLVNGTHYNVAGGEGATGTVNAVVAPTALVEWHIHRATTRTQGTDYVANDPFPAETHETALDRLTTIAQEDDDRYDRTPHFRKSDTYDGGEPHLPGRVDRPNKVLAFDENGDFTLSTEDLSDIEGAATSATAAAASAAAAATSETNAATSETKAANSAAAAEAAAQGWKNVTTLTSGTHNLEITDARTYYILDAGAGTVTVNLPAIGTDDGILFGFEVADVTNTITIARDGTDTINGVAGDYTSLTAIGDVVHFIGDDGAPDNWSATLISRVAVDDVTIQQSGRTLSVKNLGVDTAQLAASAVEEGKIADDAVTPAKAVAGVNAQTGTTYTLALTDNLNLVTCDNAAAITLTVPTNASVAFTADEVRIDVAQIGAGALTITGDTGVTVNGVSAGSATLTGQYSAASLVKIATDTWLLLGDHGGVA